MAANVDDAEDRCAQGQLPYSVLPFHTGLNHHVLIRRGHSSLRRHGDIASGAIRDYLIVTCSDKHVMLMPDRLAAVGGYDGPSCSTPPFFKDFLVYF